MASYASARDVTRHTAQLVRAPRRVRPSEAAARYLRTEKGPWDPRLAPMMIEPLDLLGSREYNGIVFVGPARTSKTMSLILGGTTYIVTCAPGDTLITQMSQDTARDFSRTDLDRAIRHSPELSDAISPRARDDNTYDKFFRSGMIVKLGWPSVSQLSGKTLRYVFLTDYDRPENRDNVDGEGPMWDLAYKRIETFMSRGKCVAESSPGGEYTRANWKPETPHEAPPAAGILSLYNRGTRARWYWPCLHCGAYFQAEPGLGNFSLPQFEKLQELVRSEDLASLADRFARVACRACGASHEIADRDEMNQRGIWLHEGQSIVDGRREGSPRRTSIASFWQGGLSATYQSWHSLVFKYLQAVSDYARTGEENALRATTNTDQAAPYLPQVIAKRRGVEHLIERAESWPQGILPVGARFLTAAGDVHGNRFIVQVQAWGVGLESWLVDRFEITASQRAEGARTAALDPASYLEDWNVLFDQVVAKEYPVQGFMDLKLPIALLLVDSGGRAGVTANAYDFWRRARTRGLGGRVMLVKGTGRKDAARCVLTYPDARERSDREAGGRGDVPVWLINTNTIKDGVAGALTRDQPGPGYLHLPDWLPKSAFEELVAETRDEKGWTRPRGVANESFDLAVYNRAAVIALKAEQINWTSPPSWARPLGERVVAGAPPMPAARRRRVRDPGIG